MEDSRRLPDLAAQVIDLVRARLGPHAEAEVFVAHEETALTRFANSFIHQNVADSATRVDLRLHTNGRTSGGATSTLDDEGLRRLVSRAAAATALLPPDPLWAGVTPPMPSAGRGAFDEATAAAAPADRAARVKAFVDAAEGASTAGYCRTTRVVAAFANTAGHLVRGGYTTAGMDGVARAAGPVADGVARAASFRLADIAGEVLGTRAAAKARAGVDPVELPPGRYEVVLEPQAVGDLLEHLAIDGFNGKAVVERRSFVSLGERQFDPALSLVDDATTPDAIGPRFDAEGTPKRRLELVRDGVTVGVAHDRRTAREAGAQSTGHAIPGGATFGAEATHLSIRPRDDGDAASSTANDGTATGDATAGMAHPARDPDVADDSVRELVAGVRHGLLVSDLWYSRVLDPRTLVVTGLTRNGVWLISNGEIGPAVRNLRFTQSYPRALGPGRVLGVGREAFLLPPHWDFNARRAPALRLASWQFTGGAAG